MIYEDIRKEAEKRIGDVLDGSMYVSVDSDGEVVIDAHICRGNLRTVAEALLWLAEPESWDDR